MDFYNKYGQLTGILVNGNYITHRSPERHYFRKYQGYGIDESIIRRLYTLKCVRVVIIEHLKNGDQRALYSTLEAWKEAARSSEGSEDAQKVLKIEDMKVER